MYVVKVGEYYVRYAKSWTIDLSKEVMTGFDKKEAKRIAKLLDAKVIKISECKEVTDEE